MQYFHTVFHTMCNKNFRKCESTYFSKLFSFHLSKFFIMQIQKFPVYNDIVIYTLITLTVLVLNIKNYFQIVI